MASLAKNVVWGSSPTNYFDFSYEKQRSGTTQQYKITVSCKPCTGASYFGFPIYLTISLDGTAKVSAYTLKAASPSRWSSAIEYTTGWLSVANKVSGTTALSIRIYSGDGSTRDTTYKYNLPIDVTTSTVSATNANIGGKSTITIKRMNSSLTHTLEYKMDGQSSYTNIATKTASTSISWTVPTSAYALIPNDKEIGITIRCTTFSGSTSLGSDTCTIKATTTDASAPTVSVTAEDVDANTLALTGNSKKIIAGYSDIKVTATVSANDKANITGTTLKCGASTASGTSKTFTNASSDSISATATDSRGYSTTKKVTNLTLINYIKPTVNVTVTRSSPTSDTITVTAKGNYYNGSFGATSNTLAVQLRFKPKSQSAYQDADAYQTMTTTISGNTYTAKLTLSGFEYTKQYSLRVRVTDKIHKYGGELDSAVYSNTEIKKGVPMFDWGEDDFQFNVPIRIRATADAQPNSNAKVAIRTGPDDGQHLDIDTNEIIAKDDASTLGTFALTGSEQHFYIGDTIAFRLGKDDAGEFMRSAPTLSRTYSAAANMYLTTAGTFGIASASSERYKRDIEDAKDIDADAVLKIPVRQFRYKPEHKPIDREAEDLYLGFIAEEVAEVFPDAVDRDEEGRPEMWSSKVLIPAMLKVIQDMHKEIADLKKAVQSLTEVD